MLKDAARLPQLKLNPKPLFGVQRSTTRSPRSVYIIISVFVIAKTFFKMFNCYVLLYVLYSRDNKKNDCTKNTVCRNFMKTGQNISSDSESDSY